MAPTNTHAYHEAYIIEVIEVLIKDLHPLVFTLPSTSNVAVAVWRCVHRDHVLLRRGIAAKCYLTAGEKNDCRHIGQIGGQNKHPRMTSSRSWSKATSLLSLRFVFLKRMQNLGTNNK